MTKTGMQPTQLTDKEKAPKGAYLIGDFMGGITGVFWKSDKGKSQIMYHHDRGRLEIGIAEGPHVVFEGEDTKCILRAIRGLLQALDKEKAP